MEGKYTLHLPKNSVNSILTLLQTAPLAHKDSDPIIKDIVRQCQEQDQDNLGVTPDTGVSQPMWQAVANKPGKST